MIRNIIFDLGNITNDETIEVINKRNEFKYQKLTEDFLHEWYKKQPINRDIVEIAKTLKKNGYNLFVLSNMANWTYEYLKKMMNSFHYVQGLLYQHMNI